jgi:hypothetical protein
MFGWCKRLFYRLGLLRALVRIADGAPGLALNRSDDWVELPLGAVGLFWIMLYCPLTLKHHLRHALDVAPVVLRAV